MRRDDCLDPVDAIVRDALAPDRVTARRLAAGALTVRPVSTRFVPVLAAFAIVVAAAVGVTRYALAEPPIMIRGEGDVIVIETGSGRNKTTEVLRGHSSSGGVVLIRKGGVS